VTKLFVAASGATFFVADSFGFSAALGEPTLITSFLLAGDEALGLWIVWF